MQFLSNSLSPWILFLSGKKMFNLVNHYRVHCEMPVERKPKKRTSDPLERTLGMVGYLAISTPPLTYASVDESVGSDTNKWP